MGSASKLFLYLGLTAANVGNIIEKDESLYFIRQLMKSPDQPYFLFQITYDNQQSGAQAIANSITVNPIFSGNNAARLILGATIAKEEFNDPELHWYNGICFKKNNFAEIQLNSQSSSIFTQTDFSIYYWWQKK